jgi:hypothetical protein
MATKSNPFAGFAAKAKSKAPAFGAKANPFEKSGKDKEMKAKGKEGSKKEEAFDATQMAFKKGGCKK